MSTATPSFLQVLATSVTATNKAGDLIRDILHKGNLEIVEKTGADDLQVIFQNLKSIIKFIFLHNFRPKLIELLTI